MTISGIGSLMTTRAGPQDDVFCCAANKMRNGRPNTSESFLRFAKSTGVTDISDEVIAEVGERLASQREDRAEEMMKLRSPDYTEAQLIFFHDRVKPLRAVLCDFELVARLSRKGD
jgi:hypothetical protein